MNPPRRARLILVCGPAGSGKTTLAYALAQQIGAPVISRDAIKEGMVAAHPGFVPTTDDPLTRRTYDVFFAVLDLLLEAEVTVVAEAAFGHRVWVQGLDRLDRSPDLRVVRCVVEESVARSRMERRMAEDHTRAAHADAEHLAASPGYVPLSCRGSDARCGHDRRIPPRAWPRSPASADDEITKITPSAVNAVVRAEARLRGPSSAGVPLADGRRPRLGGRRRGGSDPCGAAVAGPRRSAPGSRLGRSTAAAIAVGLSSASRDWRQPGEAMTWRAAARGQAHGVGAAIIRQFETELTTGPSRLRSAGSSRPIPSAPHCPRGASAPSRHGGCFAPLASAGSPGFESAAGSPGKRWTWPVEDDTVWTF